MGLTARIAAHHGTPTGLRFTAYGYHDPNKVPAGPTNKDGLRPELQTHYNTIHHYLINDDVLQLSPTEQDNRLTASIRKGIHRHYNRHVQRFLTDKRFLNITEDAKPTLYIYKTNESTDRYRGAFAHYNGHPTLPEGQTTTPQEHNTFIIPSDNDITTCQDNALHTLKHVLPYLPTTMKPIQHLHNKPPQAIHDQIKKFADDPYNKAVYQALNQPIPTTPTKTRITKAKQDKSKLNAIIKPSYTMRRAAQNHTHARHNQFANWFQTKLTRN